MDKQLNNLSPDFDFFAPKKVNQSPVKKVQNQHSNQTTEEFGPGD